MNLICFKHPEYRGGQVANLSCKACFDIFVLEIKEREEQLRKLKIAQKEKDRIEAWLDKYKKD